MPITPELAAVIERLNQELLQIEQQATTGLDRLRELVSRFPGNALLIQNFAYFNTALFFVETSRIQLQTAVETISPPDIPSEIVQETGEGLGTLLGRVVEVRLRAERLTNRLE